MLEGNLAAPQGFEPRYADPESYLSVFCKPLLLLHLARKVLKQKQLTDCRFIGQDVARCTKVSLVSPHFPPHWNSPRQSPK
jgi:hypothetical protein